MWNWINDVVWWMGVGIVGMLFLAVLIVYGVEMWSKWRKRR